MKKGISLIVLIIVIIVMIILSGIIIFNGLINNNILEKSNYAVDKQNVASIKQEFIVNLLNEQSKNNNFKINDVNATKTGNGYQNIAYWIPSILNTKYEDWFEISNGEIVMLADKLSNEEQNICSKVGIKEIEGLLPREYKQIEYIKSTGVQYIDTEVQLKDISKMTVDFKCIGTANNKWFCGTRNFQAGIYNYSFYTQSGFTYSQNNLNNRTIANGINTDSSTTDTIYLFARNWEKNYNNSWIKIFSCQMYDKSNNLIRDYIPCCRKSDNISGLYDIVTNEFYTNSGASIFFNEEDDVTVEIPNEYEKVDYIKSTGKEFIDTKISLQNLGCMIVDYQYVSIADNTWICGNGYIQAGLYYGSLYTSAQFTYSQSNINSRTLAMGLGISTNATKTIYLFARNWEKNYNNATIKIFACKMYDKSNNLIRNYIPCYRKSDNISGLYDVIDKKFYINEANTNNFLIPPK